MLTPTKQGDLQDDAIVAKTDRLPEPTAFRIETAKKPKEGLDLEVHVLAEFMSGPGLVKRGYVKPNIPSFGAFELYCDEGSAIGDSDTAPAPLSYLVAGLAFYFSTHPKACTDIELLSQTVVNAVPASTVVISDGRQLQGRREQL